MSTTTIRLEEDLKDRIAAVAKRTGQTSHAFILEAIEQTVRQAEFDADLQRVAATRWKRLLADGESLGWDDAKRYLEGRAAGKRIERPSARKIDR